jgi:hypothetical protein
MTSRSAQPKVFDKRKLLRALWRDHMHVEAQALALSPVAVRARTAHAWAPAERVMQELERFPAGLLATWLGLGVGHLVFTHQPSCYQPGSIPWQERTLRAVAYVSLADVDHDPLEALLSVFHLWDHLLGCGARDDGLWLAEGGGLTPALREVGAQFVRANALGYGHGALAVDNARDYFAHTLLLYLRDPRRLNVLDPLVYKLYRATLMSEAFWLKQ